MQKGLYWTWAVTANGNKSSWAVSYTHLKKGNDELKDLVWDEVKKLDEAGEVDKLADKYELDKSMLCISEDKDAEDSDSTEADAEESADSTEKDADSESK